MLSKIMHDHLPVSIEKMRVPDFIKHREAVKSSQVKHVNQNSGWVEIESCPVCDSHKNSLELETLWGPILKCNNCELRFHKLIPKNFNDLYQDESYTTHSIGGDLEHFNYRKNRFGNERIRLLQKFIGGLESKTVLDVGCGMGDFLAAAKGHFREAIGSEFSIHLRELASFNTGLKIFSEPLEKFPRDNIDVITAFDVIEHVPNPLDFMNAARNLLSPNGFVMLYTPNYDSLSIKVMGDKSSLIAPPHIQLFTHNALTVLGGLSGFKVVHYETRGLDISSIISYLEFTEGSASKFLKEWAEYLQAALNESQCSDYARVIYQKI